MDAGTAPENERALAETVGAWSSDELDDYLAAYERELAPEADPAWRRAYKPFSSQQRFHETPARFKGFSGPVGSGKSLALAAEAIRLAYANPGLPGVIAAPTYRMLADVTRDAVIGLLRSAGIPHTVRLAENVVVLAENNSRIRFRSMDKPEALIGSNLAWFGVDELSYCKEDSWKRLEARLRHPQARELCGFAVWTPKGFDWVYQRFIGPEKRAGYAAVIAAPGENKALPDGFYDALKVSYDARFYEQEVLGKYLNVFAGQVYWAFDRGVNVTRCAYDPALPLVWSLDFNVDPMASVICQVDRGRVRVIEEIILPNSNTPEVCNVFWSRMAKRNPSNQRVTVRVFGDPAGSARSHSGADRSDWALVRQSFAKHPEAQLQFMVASSAPPVKARVNAVNSMLRSAADVPNLFIDPGCKELIADLEQVAWKVDAAGASIGDLDKRDPKRTHVSDALGYMIEAEFGARVRGGPRAAYVA